MNLCAKAPTMHANCQKYLLRQYGSMYLQIGNQKVVHKTQHALYLFRYMVSYIQFKVDLSVGMLEFTWVANRSYASDGSKECRLRVYCPSLYRSE